MKFSPEKYRIPDEPMRPFIDADEIEELIKNAKHDKDRLSMAETAMLLNATDPDLVDEIKEGASRLKKAVYGNRIVLFAPLYIGNKCTNNCQYCGFRASNKEQIRTTLNRQQIISDVETLEDQGQKRLILVFGEHPEYSPEFIADATRTVYSVKKGN